MRLGIDAREICNRPAGKGQYLLRVILEWQRTKAFSMTLYIEEGQELPPVVDATAVTTVKVPDGLLWHRSVARRLASDGIEVYFAALSYQSAIWNKVPTVTVVHDLAVFRLPKLVHNRKAKIIERLTLKPCVRKSAALVTVSQSTKNDLVEIGGADPEKVQVIYLAAATETDTPAKPLTRTARKPYLLFMGTLEPRKNIATILKAYAGLSKQTQSNVSLKLVGKIGWGGEDYKGMAAELGIAERVEFLGYVSDEERVSLLAEAAIFLFPSIYEGFGLPVLEAMAVGTPVITSSVSSLPEVVGEEGLTVAPDDHKGLSKTIEDLLGDTAAYDRQSSYLFERSKQFSWKKTGAELTEVIKKVEQAA